jgi:CO/xanthine dehydrogenase Mo-binding subunit
MLYNDPGLDVTNYWTSPNPPTSWEPPHINLYTTTPSDVELAVVEVDVETGKIKILKYVIVHDAGRLINPKIVENQVIGGNLQGIGGAIYEELVYDENGQLLTTTFMDYLMPTAMEIPEVMEMDHVITPAPFTPLGTKGMGEGGSMNPPSVIMNAVEDALGVPIRKMPLKPENVLEMVKEAREKKLL